MFKRLFSHDPETRTTRYFYHDPDTDEATIETQVDIEPILEHNARLRGEQTKLDRWGEGKIVASVPMHIYMEWLMSGKTEDQAFVKRWLNDPENRKYRTFLGRV